MTLGQMIGRCLTTYDTGDDRVPMPLLGVGRGLQWGFLLSFPDEDLSLRVQCGDRCYQTSPTTSLSTYDHPRIPEDDGKSGTSTL